MSASQPPHKLCSELNNSLCSSPLPALLPATHFQQQQLVGDTDSKAEAAPSLLLPATTGHSHCLVFHILLSKAAEKCTLTVHKNQTHWNQTTGWQAKISVVAPSSIPEPAALTKCHNYWIYRLPPGHPLWLQPAPTHSAGDSHCFFLLLCLL